MRTKIILQDLNRHYLGTDGTWVNSCQKAREFEQTYSALVEGLKHAEKRPQIVWCFGDPRMTLYFWVRSEEDRTYYRGCAQCPLIAAN